MNLELMDIQQCITLLHKNVKINLKDNESIAGTVYTIDPVSKNVILMVKEDGQNPQVQIVMKQAIQDISIIEATSIQVDIQFDAIENEKCATLDEITEWLRRNRLEFDVCDERIQVEGVSIYPPYRPQDCLGSNVIVLGRIHKLLTVCHQEKQLVEA